MRRRMRGEVYTNRGTITPSNNNSATIAVNVHLSFSSPCVCPGLPHRSLPH